MDVDVVVDVDVPVTVSKIPDSRASTSTSALPLSAVVEAHSLVPLCPISLAVPGTGQPVDSSPGGQ